MTPPSAPREPRAERRAKVAASSSSLPGMLWFAGWLFTTGFAHLGFWKGVLALIVWPYFLGVTLR